MFLDYKDGETLRHSETLRLHRMNLNRAMAEKGGYQRYLWSLRLPRASS
jgi:hypothetical protein